MARELPHFTLSMDEGFALRDRLDKGERVELTFRLEVEEPRDLATEYTVARSRGGVVCLAPPPTATAWTKMSSGSETV